MLRYVPNPSSTDDDDTEMEEKRQKRECHPHIKRYAAIVTENESRQYQ